MKKELTQKQKELARLSEALLLNIDRLNSSDFDEETKEKIRIINLFLYGCIDYSLTNSALYLACTQLLNTTPDVLETIDNFFEGC